MDKVECLEFLTNRFRGFSELKQELFTKLVLRLLNETFLIKDRTDDKKDYYNASELKEELEKFFQVLNYGFYEDKILQIIYIKTEDNKNRMHLTKFETVLLLCLRVAYYKNSKKSGLINVASITFEDLKQDVLKTNIFKDEKSNNEYIEAIRKLRKFKIVDFSGGKNFSNESRIFIYPSIAYVVSSNDINDLDNRIKAFNKEDKNNEEVN